MIHIVTDSTSGLAPDTLTEWGIPAVPQFVHFGETTFRDGVDIHPSDFFDRLDKTSELPKTSAPAPADFLPIWGAIAEQDPDAVILGIHPSEAVSGTLRSARPAVELFHEQYPGVRVELFDTRSISLGLGLMVAQAAEMLKAGADLDDLLHTLAVMRDSQRIFFVVDTLEYLAKGGRIGKASHLVGSLLDIKPTLTLKDGVVESYSKTRTRKKAVAELTNLIIEGIEPPAGVCQGDMMLGVAHSVAEREARQLADTLTGATGCPVSLFSEIGPAIGVHVGPRVLAAGTVQLP